MTTSTIALPVVKTLSFAKVVALFGDQVLNRPIQGQRNHKANLQKGRKHITVDANDVPTTQAIIHAVEVTRVDGKKLGLQLMDGYHRISHWMKNSCPFSALTVIVHFVDERVKHSSVNEVASLARTIDNRAAAKTPGDLWYGAMRAVRGFEPKSNAYRTGKNANAFLRATLGSSATPHEAMVETLRNDLEIHKEMDELFAYSEKHLSGRHRSQFFHVGVSLALFNHFKSKGLTKADSKVMRQALLISSGYGWDSAPKAAREVAAMLSWLGSEKVNEKLRKAMKGRNAFFEKVSITLAKSLPAALKA